MEKIRVEEVRRIITDKIKNYGKKVELEEVGSVLSVGDGIARVYGLENVMSGELVEFSHGVRGVVLNLEEDNVGVAVLGSCSSITEGSTVRRLKDINSVPVGEGLLGRVVDALGEPIDGKGSLNCKERGSVEVKAPGIIKRKSVTEPLQTGLKCIDAMTPIGRGQESLLLGIDKQGKLPSLLTPSLTKKVRVLSVFMWPLVRKLQL